MLRQTVCYIPNYSFIVLILFCSVSVIVTGTEIETVTGIETGEETEVVAGTIIVMIAEVAVAEV